MLRATRIDNASETGIASVSQIELRATTCARGLGPAGSGTDDTAIQRVSGMRTTHQGSVARSGAAAGCRTDRAAWPHQIGGASTRFRSRTGDDARTYLENSADAACGRGYRCISAKFTGTTIQKRAKSSPWPYNLLEASMSSALSGQTADAIEVWAVQLPGRAGRYREPPIAAVRAIVDAVVPALLPALDRPYALFGHMGGVVAFEVAPHACPWCANAGAPARVCSARSTPARTRRYPHTRRRCLRG